MSGFRKGKRGQRSMKIRIALLVTLSFFCFSTARAEFCNDSFCDGNKIYAKVFGGANFLQTKKRDWIKTDYNTGYIVSGSIGYYWRYGFHLEAEYAYRRNCLRRGHFFDRSFKLSGHFQSSSYMANLIWDLPISRLSCCRCWKIYPIVGGGVGYDFQQIRSENRKIVVRRNSKRFAWQIIAGLGYPIFCNTDLSLEYRFHKGGFKHIYSHSVGVGLTYSFGLNS
jgi:opacity protein-like surface antigen